jgi:hypothetical protein
MASKEAPLIERAQTSFTQLSHAATNLNTASEQLDQAISVLETALLKLNLNISAWTTISSSGEGESMSWWSRDVGYTQLGDKWCIALRKTSGDYNFPEYDTEKVWSFNEAARWMRIEAVGKLPDLLDKLVAQTEDITKKTKSKTAQAYDLAAVINEVTAKQDDWRAKLQSAMIDTQLTFSAEAIAKSEVLKIGNELKITAPEQYKIDLGTEELKTALKHLGHPDLRFTIVFKRSPKPASQDAQAGKK